jgi:uncharacterized delta-60 repeat protein
MRMGWMWPLLAVLGLAACGPERVVDEWTSDGGTRPGSGVRPGTGTKDAGEGLPTMDELDPGFGTLGHVRTDFAGMEDQAAALLVQEDGKLVAAGSAGLPQPGNWALPRVGLARYTVNGALDTTFGTGGQVTYSMGQWGSRAHAMLPLEGGKLLVAGFVLEFNVPNVLLMRLDSRGALDTSFGTRGVATYGAPFEEEVGLALGLQPDGKVLVAGRGGREALGRGIVVRFTADGQLDTTFGQAGRAVVEGQFESRALVVEPDGAFVVSGEQGPGSFLARFNAQGTPDLDFRPPRSSVFLQVGPLVRQPDGRLVVGGVGVQDNRGSFGLMRFLPDGTVDSTFGQSGRVVTPVRGADRVRALALQQDGRLVAVGEAGGSLSQVGMARYLPDGSLDSSFGTGGTIAGSVGYAGQDASAVVVDSQGIIIAGRLTRGETPTWDFLLARFRL